MSCPIDTGTSPDLEAERWGSDPRAAMIAAEKARRARDRPALQLPPPRKVILVIEPLQEHVTAASDTLRAYQEATRTVPIALIQKVCADYHGLAVRELLSCRVFRSIVRVRQLGYYLSRELTMRSLPEIGREFGGKDHSTVCHGIDKIESLLAVGDTATIEALDALRALLPPGRTRPKLVAAAPEDRAKPQRGGLGIGLHILDLLETGPLL